MPGKVKRKAGRRRLSAEDRGEREQHITHSARRAIQEFGADGASMRRIARIAQVNEATLYLYFRNKDELIDRVAAEVYREYLTEIRQIFDSPRRCNDKLSFFVERDLRVYLEEPEICRLIDFAGRMRGDHRLVAATRPFYEEVVALIDRCVADGIAAGDLRDDVPASATRNHLLATIGGCRDRVLYGGESISIVEESKRMLDLLLHGVSRPSDAGATDRTTAGLHERLRRLEEIVKTRDGAGTGGTTGSAPDQP